jgi:death-on-curing protein
MREPRFLAAEEVVVLHAAVLAAYGGLAGIRDPGGLISAVQAPHNHWFYSGGDLADLSAVLLLHLVRNHPFADGNKRVALASALVFLDAQGFSVRADPDALEWLTLEAAQGRLDVDPLATAIRGLRSED